MSTSSALLLSVLVLILVPVWLLFLWGVPSQLISMFRYSLWQLRDRVVDDVRGGALPNDRFTLSLLGQIETTIAMARRCTLLQCIFMPRMPREILRAREAEQEAWIETLPPDAARSYQERHAEYLQIVARHLALGSLSGWLGIVALFPFAIIKAIQSRVRSDPSIGERRENAGGHRRRMPILVPVLARAALQVLFALPLTLPLVRDRIVGLQHQSNRPDPQALSACAG